MTALAVQTIQKTNQTANPPTILQRVADRDQTVIKDCIDNYGNFVWALARKFTNSTEEAEAATQEIFTDIWRYAERIESKQYDENVLIGLIAKRRIQNNAGNFIEDAWRAPRSRQQIGDESSAKRID